MTPNQKKYYLLGLEDAIKELQTEITTCESEMRGEVLVTWKYALRNGISAIKDLYEVVEQGL